MANPDQLTDQDIERFVQACVQDEAVPDAELQTFRHFLESDTPKAREVALRLVDERLIRGWFRSEADGGFVRSVSRRLQEQSFDTPSSEAKLDPAALQADPGRPGPRGHAVPKVRKYTFLKYLLVPLAAVLLYLVFVAVNQMRQNRDTGVADPAIAAAAVVRGQVSVLSGQARQPLEPGATIRANDIVHTGAGAAATLRWSDGSEVQLGTDTEAALTLTGGALHLHLRRGSAIVKVVPQPDGRPALITTTLSQMGCNEGGASLDSTAERDRVRVAAGSLTVQRIADGASVTLTTGQSLEVNHGGALTPQPAASP